MWNTFETRARCPGCDKQWRFTQCLACQVSSPHEEWYHDEVPDEAGAEADRSVRVAEPAEARAGAA